MDWATLGQMLWCGIERGAIYILFALGLTLCFGVMRIVNMAHGELFMLGAMGVYSLMTYFGMSFFPAMLLCIALVAILGIAFNRVAVEPFVIRNPLAVLLSTIAVSFVLVQGGNAFWGAIPRTLEFPFPQVLNVASVSVSAKGIAAVIVSAITVFTVYLFLTKAKMGKAMRATSENAIGSTLVGINVKRIYVYTMMVASAIAATAGIFAMSSVTASPSMGQGLLIIGFVVVIVGGMGNIMGCIVVGLTLGIVEAIFGQYVSMIFRQAFLYGIMVVVLLVKPQGLFGGR